MSFVQTAATLSRKNVGNKAWNLKQLHDAGYTVPSFVVLPTTTTQEIVNKTTDIDPVCREILEQLPLPESLAIRSSGLQEDTAGSAQAGQFYSAMAIKPADLAATLLKTLQHRKNRTAARSGKLALIVQTYLNPEQQGVLFTRDPRGTQSMIIEYSQHSSVVSGETASHLTYHPNDPPRKSELPHLPTLTKISKQIEAAWEWPQDIEWLYHQKKLYILQTRAITSIPRSSWNGLWVAEKELATHTTPYFYQQTLLTEQFTHPRQLSISLLRSLYSYGGPVAQTYRRIGMTYCAQQLHHMLAGVLYIDREAELHTIFPALSLQTSTFGRPRLATWRGSGTTVKNVLVSTFMRTSNTSALRKRIETALQLPLPTTCSPTERWQAFLAVYPLVYEVSLRTQKALSLLPRNKPVPQGPIDHVPLNPHHYGLSRENIVGNSLSLDDTSPFTAHTPQTDTSQSENVSAREILQIRARTYLALREYTRWLTVKYLHLLRQDIYRYAEQYLPSEPQLIFHASWEEVQKTQLDYVTLQTRAEVHEAERNLTPPTTLASHTLTTSNHSPSGLTPGQASGVVRTIEELQTSSDTEQILYTQTLHPELTQYFPYVQGIITATGGTLSHLAIMAREHGLPVIKSSTPYEKLQKRFVEIDGNTGALNTKERTNIEGKHRRDATNYHDFK
jgi:phosphohistidine swiveling domain-containing protein